MRAGLAAGVATTSRLRAKGTTSLTFPAPTSGLICASSAEANTSAGAPCSICARSSEEAAKLKVTFVPEWLRSNWDPIAWKASVNEAAANTVRSAARAPDGNDSTTETQRTRRGEPRRKGLRPRCAPPPLRAVSVSSVSPWCIFRRPAAHRSLPNEHLRRLDDRGGCVADLQPQPLHRVAGDHTDDLQPVSQIE